MVEKSELLSYYLSLIQNKIDELNDEIESQKTIIKAQHEIIIEQNFYIDSMVEYFKEWKVGKIGLIELNDKLYDLSEKCFNQYGK